MFSISLKIIKNNQKISSLNCLRIINNSSRYSSTSNQENKNDKINEIKIIADIDDDFPVLNILPYGKVQKERKVILKSEVISPRYKRLSKNHDWTNVWPHPRNFHPSTVPLSVHMSYVDDHKIRAPLSKHNNPELLKIPNFLHLTPIMVQKQCELLKKKFCTKWPSQLKTDDDCEKHFPITIISKDYVFSGPSIRWPNGRRIELNLKMSRLQLDEHSKDKMIRLLDKKYNKQLDLITIQTDSCPLRKQNYDYAHYLLTVLYFESWKFETWEKEKTYYDWEKYHWHNDSPSKRSLLNYLEKTNSQKSGQSKEQLENQIKNDENIQNYINSVCKLYDIDKDNNQNQKEIEKTMDDYKKSVVKILFP